MRDICQCESHGCKAKGGIQLDTRTIQKHRCKDQLQIFKNAKVDSEHALDERLDHISNHLSISQLMDSPAQTTGTTNDLCHQIANLSISKSPLSALTDSPAQTSSTTNNLCQQIANLTFSKSPLTNSPAQTSSTTNDLCHQLNNLRLNSNEAPSTKDHHSKTPPVHPSESQRRSTIQDVLTHLSDIWASATALQRNTDSAFKNSVKVSHFTLDSLLLDCYSLQTSLSKVTLKAAPVTLMKEDISEILSKVQVQLEATKSELAKKEKLAPRPAAPVYFTGMQFIKFIYNI
jgi:hypothetical protein